MFLVDTNVLSEVRKAERGNGGVINWATETASDLMFLSVIALYEIEVGVLRAERSDQRKGAMLRTWLEMGVRPTFADRIVGVDDRIAVLAARWNVPDPAPFRDSLIAATAQAYDLKVVTRDTRDFSRFPEVEVLNPWT
jgi:hypothetical protein